MNESIVIKIPTRILKEEVENVNGTIFRWIEMSKILNIDGYGCWFPAWLITNENSLISKIKIQDEYTLYGQVDKKENVLTVEHKEKVPGKRFKRYKYNAVDFAELFQVYYKEWYKKLDECQKTYCIVSAASYSDQGRMRNDTYRVGYIVDGFFYDYVNENNESKRISAKSFHIIVDNLNAEKAYIAKEFIEKQNIVTEETLKKIGEDKAEDCLLKECKEMCLHSQFQDLGHGFKKGINNITASKVIKWRHNFSIDWLALLWDLSDNFKLIDFGDNWFKIDIQSSIERENFHKKVVNFGEMQEQNFNIDIKNDLWRTHKPNVDNNLEMLEKIIRKTKEE